jgi:tRNA pseudouridine38-40 synthase
METYQSIVAYDGTAFQGFQRLGEGQRTVQGVLEDALRRMGWNDGSLTAAGRTDAGVHARGQVIAYRLEWRHGLAALTRAFNAHVPSDVGVRQTAVAAPGFHPRFSARRRTYSYALLPDEVPDPLAERFAWRLWPAPDLGLMNGMAQSLVGRHDFGAFGPSPTPGGHTFRRVFSAGWTREGRRMVFEVTADAFLQHMVRRLVAAMVLVGQGREQAGWLDSFLRRPDHPFVGKMAPPQGLCLESVDFAADEVMGGANRPTKSRIEAGGAPSLREE